MGKNLKVLAAVTIGCLLVNLPLSRSNACGLDWVAPTSHFDGVDFQGHVHKVETLGSLNVGGRTVPVFLIFNSGNNQISPYVGRSFQIPLLESKMVAVDPNTFKFEQPDGWFQIFWRDQNNPTLLHGTSGWAAEIKGDIITASALCGTKAVFDRGKLTQLQIGEDKLDYVYAGDRVSEIRKNGITELRIESDSATGDVSSLKIANDKPIAFQISRKPNVQNIGGSNLIVSMDKSLARYVSGSGTTKEFEFGVDDKLQPTLKWGRDGDKITWSPINGTIISDSVWNYDIKQNPDDALASAAIGRKNQKGENEFWWANNKDGVETVTSTNGVTTTYNYYKSGVLNNRLRSIRETQGGITTEVVKIAYDDLGNILREVRGNKTTVYIYKRTSSSREVLEKKQIFVDRSLESEELFEEGKRTALRFVDGLEIKYGNKNDIAKVLEWPDK